MALHIHGHCAHQCSCSQPTNNGCVADIVLFCAQNNPSATMQDLQSLVDSKYGLGDPSPPLGQVDIP